MQDHRIVSKAEWLEARKQLLAQEKDFTHRRAQLSEARRALPWERVTERYVFERARGKATLAELFDGKRQLVVYHFMFAPDAEAGCKSCSFWADGFDGITEHLAHRDVQLVAISRAPLAKLAAYRQRMGWKFEWVSSGGSTFNDDLRVSFGPDELATGQIAYNYGTYPAYGPDMPGFSVFFRGDDDTVFHTYSCYSRGIDNVNPAYQILDLVPKGRDETESSPMSWLRRHDEYGA